MAKTFSTIGLDPTLPDVKIEIGGKTRQMCFDYAAIALAEKSTGQNILRALEGEVDFASIPAMLWAALLKDDPTLKFEEVVSWVNLQNYRIIFRAILAAWLESAEEPKDDAPGEDKAVSTPKRRKTA